MLAQALRGMDAKRSGEILSLFRCETPEPREGSRGVDCGTGTGTSGCLSWGIPEHGIKACRVSLRNFPGRDRTNAVSLQNAEIDPTLAGVGVSFAEKRLGETARGSSLRNAQGRASGGGCDHELRCETQRRPAGLAFRGSNSGGHQSRGFAGRIPRPPQPPHTWPCFLQQNFRAAQR